MASAAKVWGWIACAIVLLGLAGGTYFVGHVLSEADEVASCERTQRNAGGKKPPAVDLVSSISIRREGDAIVGDFRGLQKGYSRVCVTTLYQPGSAYFWPRDGGIGGSVTPRTIGCWAGEDPSHLTLVLFNRQTAEDEYYRLPIPTELQSPASGRRLLTSYRIPQPTSHLFQCADTETAVAKCDTDDPDDHCLLMFHR